jgi:hypothetical protein
MKTGTTIKLITVGRWMSTFEHDAMLNSGMVQESYSGTTHVLLPPDLYAFVRQARCHVPLISGAWQAKRFNGGTPMLNTFHYWAQETISGLPAGVVAHLTPGAASGNTAARIDFDAAVRMGRITCWDSGNFHAEILDTESGQNLLNRHGKVDGIADLSSLLGSFLETLQPSRGRIVAI